MVRAGSHGRKMKDQAKHSGKPGEFVGKYWIAVDENGIVWMRTIGHCLELMVLALSHLICPCIRGGASQVEAL